MTTSHDSGDPAKRNGGSGIPRAGRPSADEENVTLSEEETERMVQSVGQAYATMESAGRYIEEQDRSPAGVALVAALASARRAMADVLMRLLAAWAWAMVALGLAA